MLWRAEFTVRGTGLFPFDMLRYDRCYPARGEDVSLLTLVDGRAVTLVCVRPTKLDAEEVPSKMRWASFGWRVVSQSTVRRL